MADGDVYRGVSLILVIIIVLSTEILKLIDINNLRHANKSA